MKNKIKGVALIAESTTSNGNYYTKESLKDLNKKDIPIYMDYKNDKPIGICNLKFKDNKVFFEGEVDLEERECYVAPFMIVDNIIEKDGVKYIKDVNKSDAYDQVCDRMGNEIIILSCIEARKFVKFVTK